MTGSDDTFGALSRPDGTRDQILALLRRGPRTVEDLTTRLDLTANAVRVQLAMLERDEFVQRIGKRAGVRKPSIVYGLTDEAERSFSRAYAPVLAELMTVLSETLDERSLRRILRRVGEGLASAHMTGVDEARARRAPPADQTTFENRVSAATELLQELGASVDVEFGPTSTMIRGHACPLADATQASPCVCLALERLLQVLIGTPVRERCDREGRPRCRFVVTPSR